MKKVIYFVAATLIFFSMNVIGQKVASQLNNQAYKAQATIGGITNTVSTVTTATETAKDR